MGKRRTSRPSSSSSGGGNGGAEARSDSQLPYKKWLASYASVSRWFAQYDIERLLDEHGGLVRLRNFLPPHVAQGAFDVVRRIKDAHWIRTDSAKDYASNNIEHAFYSCKSAPGLEELLRIFVAWQPERLQSFSAAKYECTHHIEPHDDCAFTTVAMDDGTLVECSRDIAVILYLTPEWRTEHGGVLRDLDGHADLTPEFNSAVIFRVPRMHEVTPVTTTEHTRYSLFGWYLQPGRLYDLERRKRFADLLIESLPLAVDQDDADHESSARAPSSSLSSSSLELIPENDEERNARLLAIVRRKRRRFRRAVALMQQHKNDRMAARRRLFYASRLPSNQPSS